MDRRNAVVADGGGISLGKDGRVVELPWGDVEVAWAERREGRRSVLSVVVLQFDGTAHTCEVTAGSPGELQAWLGAFTALTAYYRVDG
jgi:hypothetical protein